MAVDDSIEDGQPSLYSHSFRTKGFDVRVSACEGFLCKIRLKCLIAMSATEVFNVFTNPDNSNVFRQIDSCDSHQEISCVDGVKEIHVEQSSTVGFLWFKRRFTTALRVLEDRQKLTTMFSLLRPGVMAAFQGFWTLTDVPLPKSEAPNGGTSEPTGLCLAYLEQDVAPALVDRAPGWFQGIMRGICSNTVIKLMEDLRLVAALRRRGVSMDVILSSKIRGWGGIKDKYRVPDREDPKPDIERAAAALGINLLEPNGRGGDEPGNAPKAPPASTVQTSAATNGSAPGQQVGDPSKAATHADDINSAVASFPLAIALEDKKDGDGDADSG